MSKKIIDLGMNVLTNFHIKTDDAKNALTHIYETTRNKISNLIEIAEFGRLKEKPFVNHSKQMQKDDVFYFFSDGFIDQTWSSNNQKLKRLCLFSKKNGKKQAT